GHYHQAGFGSGTASAQAVVLASGGHARTEGAVVTRGIARQGPAEFLIADGRTRSRGQVAGIGNDAVPQVLMGDIEAVVNDCDPHAAAARVLPGGLGVDVGPLPLLLG